jgi:hypothetical protein
MRLKPIGLIALAMIMAVTSAGVKTVHCQEAARAKDFGVTGIEVQSVKTLDTKKLNAEVRKAAGKGETWTREPVLVVLKFVGAGLKGNRKIIDVSTPPENQESATITVTESGYLDDAIGGERWRLWLQKSPEGIWTIQRALWAQLCNRPGHRFYSAERCP